MELDKEKDIELKEVSDQENDQSTQDDKPSFPDLGERFKIDSLIGVGAMGSVYRAVDKSTDKVVAIKIIKPDLARDAVAIKRFAQEVEATSKLEHENLASVYMTEQTSKGIPFIVMQYLEGKNLAQVVSDRGKLGQKRAIKIFTQIGNALKCAHDNNVLHRDLKPSNVIVSNSSYGADSCWVVDFGISKIQESTGGSTNALTKTGDIIGSPYYMSPEQCQGDPMDERSDIYSMGCLMAELLLGEPLFDGAHSVQVVLKHINEPLDEVKRKLFSRGVSKEMTAIILGCLGKSKEERYPNINELLEDLASVGKGLKPQNAKSRKASSSPKSVVISAAILVSIMAMGFMVAFNSFVPPGYNTSNPSLKNMKSSLIHDKDLRNASLGDRVSIVTLYLKNSKVTDQGLGHLKNFSLLKGVNLYGTKIGDAGLRELSKLPNIDWLNLKNTKITDEGIVSLSPLYKLRWLYLGNTAIGDEGLKVIGSMKNLKTLCLTKTQISDQGVAEIANSNITNLHVTSTRLSDKGFKSIANIKSLKYIQLNKTTITDTGLGYLAQMPNLTSISATNTNIGDKGIEKLSSASNLSSLKIGSTKITDESLISLAKLKKLTKLNLSNDTITDKNIALLKDLDKLTYLDLSHTQITDAALNTISSLPNLRSLNLSTTNVTDSGLLTLAKSKSLKTLTVFGCKDVTPEGIQKLKELKPISIK